MPVRLGLAGVAHLHAASYVVNAKSLPNCEITGVWDQDPERAKAFCANYGGTPEADRAALMARSDAVAVCSENARHAELSVAASQAGLHVLCEKPLATTVEDGERMVEAARKAGKLLMTAFPCPFAPAFERLAAKVRDGEIGRVVAVCATNRGTCPFDWFVQTDLSGGGAMIDHTVHVADLLRRLLGSEPVRVTAMTGNRTYGQTWEDTAMLTVEFADGVFATIDSSWSRPKVYKTWGDVTMNVVGERGVIEMDMFGQELSRYRPGEKTHQVIGFGSNFDRAMIVEFLAAIEEGRAPRVTGEDGLAAAKVAFAGYASARTGQPVTV
jgi:predicted dehydrogenase